MDSELVATSSDVGCLGEENGSGGTDHGTAACRFLMGGMVKSGFYVEQPDCTTADLRYTTDLRSVYLTIAREVWAHQEQFLPTASRAEPLGVMKVSGRAGRLAWMSPSRSAEGRNRQDAKIAKPAKRSRPAGVALCPRAILGDLGGAWRLGGF